MQLIKIGELAKRAKVPVATVKHYVREGLISATRKTGRTMSWYDPALVAKIRAIKELQRSSYLPLDVIGRSIDRHDAAADDLAAVEAITAVLNRHGRDRALGREELLSRGVKPADLDWLTSSGLAVPSGPDQKYRGDDLSILSTLGAARKAGISADMLPLTILAEYIAALRALVAVELRLFRDGVVRRAGAGDVGRLTTAATQLSERLVILLRRKLLLPTLHELIEQDAAPPKRTRPERRRARSTAERTRHAR